MSTEKFKRGFEQLPLLKRLSSILEQYAGDNQILKELIQNAEDAGAEKVKFLYDKSHYGTDTLFKERMQKYQGPALYAYNDAQFSSEDWEGILKIEESVKKDDPFRVGRFGLGFKSVFHMTDFVGILSGNQIGFLDPHQEFFMREIEDSDLQEPTTAFAWKIDSQEWNSFSDQYTPFKQSVFGYPDKCWSDSHLHGTIFRFPLRSNPKSSKISQSVYTEDKIRDMFESFKKEAHTNLLFLTHVEEIEFYIKEGVHSDPQLLYSVRIDKKDLQTVRQYRSEYRERIIRENAHWITEPYYVTFPLHTVLTAPSNAPIVKSWIITHYYEGGEECTLKQIMEKGPKKIPWVGICLSLDNDWEKPVGHLFCFLPLPRDESRSHAESTTGFHFHIHGYFSMEQNRRHLKWGSDDIECQWNRGLVEQALPHALHVTLDYCILHHPTLAYHLFPITNSLPVPWVHLAQAFYETVRDERIYRTRHGDWVDYKAARILAQDEVCNGIILKVLACAKETRCNLVEPPSYIIQSVEPCLPNQVSPDFVAHFLTKIDLEHHLCENERRQLIDYFSRKPADLKYLLRIPVFEKHEGGLATLDEELYIEANAGGTHLVSLCPGLRQLFHSTVEQQDPHYTVLRRVADSGIAGIGLKVIENRDVPDLLKEMLRDIKEPVLLDHIYSYREETFQLTASWHVAVWHHIERHINEVPLSAYDCIPLLKSGDRLQALDTRNALIARCSDQSTLPDEVAAAARQLGCVIVDDTSHVAHRYVAPPDPHGLLRAMSKLDNPVHQMEQLDNDSKREVRMFFASTNHANDIEFLSTIPIFETVPVMSNHEPRWVSASVAKMGTDLSTKLSVPLPDNVELVDLSHVRDKDLSSCLGIECIGVTELYVGSVLPSFDSYKREEKLRILEAIMSDFEGHRKHPNFETILHDIEFIPTQDGSFKMVRDVFDPTDDILQSLFRGLNILTYPAKQLQSDIMIAKLKQIGLSDSKNITASELFELAKFIDGQSEIASDECIQQAKAFSKFLNENNQLLHSVIENPPQMLKSLLKDLRVIPLLKHRPDSYSSAVPWQGEQQSLTSPSMASTRRFLIGSQRGVPELANEMLAQIYDWHRNPLLCDVINHLQCVIDSHRENDPASDMLFEIYKFLNETVNEETINDVSALGKWIWSGQRYVYPSEVVLDLQSDASPHFYKCPRELETYHELLHLAGVRDAVNYRDILSKIKIAHEKGCEAARTDDTHGTECLECSHDLKIVLDVVLHVKDLLDKSSNSQEELLEGLFLPVYTTDHTLLLKPLEVCTYYDCDLDVGDEVIGDIEKQGFFILHQVISEQTARAFGVPNFMSKYLDADEISFGQSESLTNRIKGILSEYKDGLAVLKELIQNADDAGATKVAFIYDGRDFSKENLNLPDENINNILGPAIWSYNDSVFEDQDFANIANLGGATKEQESTKIGKFGLGFNAVYHLTDVPSFVSRDSIVFLDPRLRYLSKCISNRSKPGIKLNLQKRANRMQRYKDMFLPFNNVFGWNMDMQEETFDGTLFRFPLRHDNDDDGNRMCEKVYNHDEVQELFRILQESAHTLLLFTQSVTSLSVYTIAADDLTHTELTESFSIHRRVNTVLRSMNSPSPDEEMKQVSECEVLRLAKRNRDRTNQMCLNGYVLNMSVTSTKTTLDGDSWWLVYNTVGSPFTNQQTSSTKGSLPIGGIAAKLEKLGDGTSFKIMPLEQEEGTFFCFLPLPIENNLPVHVNGYFAIMSNRTHLHEASKNDKDTEKADWNKHLFEDAICKAYVHMLGDVTQGKNTFFDQPNLQQNMFGLFPTSLDKLGGAFTAAFLKTVFCVPENRLLPSGNTWIDNAIFRALAREAYDSPEKNLFTRVCRQLLNRGEDESDVFTELPRVLYDTLGTCGVDMCNEHFMTIETLYMTVFLPKIIHLASPDILNLLQFAVEFFAGRAGEILNKFECIPVIGSQGERQFRYPHCTVDPGSCLRDLFDTNDGYFPLPLLDETMSSMLRERWINDLQKLGMRQSLLKPNEVLERARSISSLKRPQASKRYRALLALIARTPQDDVDTIKQELITIPFIPSVEKPQKWMLPWRGKEDFLPCVEICDVINYKHLGSVLSVPEYIPEIADAFDKLSLSPRLTPQTVLDQIKCIVNYSSATSLDVTNTSEVNTISDITRECYKWLDKNVEEHNTAICGYALPFVWIPEHTRLVEAQKCSKRKVGNYDCTPHMFHVPAFCRNYPKLAKSLAIKDQMESNDFIDALRCYKEEFGDDEIQENSRSPIFQLIQALAWTIREGNGDTQSVLESHGLIYLLNQESRLIASTHLSINTCGWMPDADSSQMCHTQISQADAEMVGVKTLQIAMLEDYMEGVNFGQTEKLTNRINRILESYPCDREILKELLQNADDAGASEIHFVLDERSFPSKRIFCDTWEHLQGPALLLFNDKPFTERDIKGIQELGEGSKGDDLIKTGKYGVGFNCVYHLTDTPTFYSRGAEIKERLCVFDPQCRYCPGALKQHPGRMFKVDESLKRRYSDVFRCYDFQDFEQEEYTLFRLPLRSETISKTSLFGKKAVRREDILALFDKFKQDMASTLIFLSHVRKISLSKIGENNELELIHSISSTVSAGKESKDAYDVALKEAAGNLKRRPIETRAQIEDIGLTECVYELTITASDNAKEVWLVSQRLGFSTPEVVYEHVRKQYRENDATLLPRGGVAYIMSSTEKPNLPVTENSENEDKNDSEDETDCKENIKYEHLQSRRCNGKLFCFLPLPQDSFLPVHVNGHFVLDSETRHDICHSMDRYTFRSQWNQLLLDAVIAPAYVRLLEAIKATMPSEPILFEGVEKQLACFIGALPHFPLLQVRQLLHPLQISIFKYLLPTSCLFPVLQREHLCSKCDVFPKGEVISIKWKSLDNAKDPVYFSSFSPAADRPINEEGLLNVLLNCRFPITYLPIQVKERIDEALEWQVSLDLSSSRFRNVMESEPTKEKDDVQSSNEDGTKDTGTFTQTLNLEGMTDRNEDRGDIEGTDDANVTKFRGNEDVNETITSAPNEGSQAFRDDHEAPAPELDNKSTDDIKVKSEAGCSDIAAKDARDIHVETASNDDNNILGAIDSHITTKVITPEAILWHLRSPKTKQAVFSLPSKVQDSPFMTSVAVYKTFKYVSEWEKVRDYISHVPLLVTNDSMLREFDSENSPVLASTFSQLISEVPQRFLNAIYINGGDYQCKILEEKFSPFIKEMSVSDLAGLLGCHLNSKVYRYGNDVKLRKEIWPWLVLLFKFLLHTAFVPEVGHVGRKQFALEVLSPLDEWCIVPSLINKKRYLIKLKTACHIFDTEYTTLRALEKLPLPRICLPPKDIDPDGCVRELLSHLIVQQDQPYRLLKALALELHCYDNISTCLKNEDADALLIYFTRKLPGNCYVNYHSLESVMVIWLHCQISNRSSFYRMR